MAPEVPARNAQRVSPSSCDCLLWPTSQRLWCAVAVISNSVGISIDPSKALQVTALKGLQEGPNF